MVALLDWKRGWGLGSWSVLLLLPTSFREISEWFYFHLEPRAALVWVTYALGPLLFLT